MRKQMYAGFFFLSLCVAFFLVGCNLGNTEKTIEDLLQTVSAITLKETSRTVTVGSSFNLSWQTTPQRAKDVSIAWNSSNSAIATVSSKGVVTAKTPGVTVITGVVNSTRVQGYCVVTVIPATTPVTGIDMSSNPQTLMKGSSITLAATILPLNATNQHITWSSSDTSVAFVNAVGTVLAVNGGDATITATSVEGGLTASCTVSVLLPVTDITINKTFLQMTIGGASESLTAEVLPVNAANKNIIWSSTNQAIAVVDQSGTVSAVAPGYANIVAHSADGDFTVACAVYVNMPIAAIIPVSAVSLNEVDITLLKGETKQLIETVTPNDATNKFVVWNSSNPYVASVDSSGLVTAVGGGSASITVTTVSGGFEAICNVTVSIKPDFIRMRNADLEMGQDATYFFDTAVYPLDTSNKALTWSSSDPAIATVDSTGLVTAKIPGTVTITATSVEKNDITTACTVTVNRTIVPEGVVLNMTSVSLPPNTEIPLTAVIFPSNAVNKNVLWFSDNTSIAEVNSSGVVTSKMNGKARITVTTLLGDFTASCEVTVSTAVTGIILDHNTIQLHKGEIHALVPTIEPATASNTRITWESNNPAVASVDTTGVVTAHGSGLATITATTDDGGFMTSATIAVVIPVTGVVLNESAKNMAAHTSYTLVARVSPDDATNKNLVWTSSDETIATVSNNGVVITNANAGTTRITVQTVDGNFTATCDITVVIGVNGISLNTTSQALNPSVTPTYQLVATVIPVDAQNKTVNWTSSNPAVATVSASGLVTAVSSGIATIIATTQEGGFTISATISVIKPVTGVALNTASQTLNSGGTYQLVATITPVDATNKALVWTSSDETIATVSSNGLVTALAKAGTTTIRAQTVDGGFSATCTITVVIRATSVSLNTTTRTLLPNDTYQLVATVNPANATNKAVTWTSSNTNIATVDVNGLVTTKVTLGSVIITATTQDSGFSATCMITVKIPVTGVTLNTASQTLNPSGTYQLFATVAPNNASNKTIAWTSSDETIATVSSNGLVTALAKAGTTTIRAQTIDGSFSATCTITVVIRATSVSLNTTTRTLLPNATYQLVATVNPANATNKAVTWTSSNTNIATVDANGLVTAKLIVGTTTITATTQDGNFTASCAITIGVPFTGITISNPPLADLNRNTLYTPALSTVISPANATNQAVIWTSSNTNVATVSQGGQILTKNISGTTDITVQTEDGSFSATCTIRVKNN